MSKKEEIQRAFNAGISTAHFSINQSAEPKYSSSNDYWEKEHGHEDDRPMSMFNVVADSLNQGFTMRFNNGMVISVQWAEGNYCNNRSRIYKDPNNRKINSCTNAEIAIWDKDGNYYMFDDDRFEMGWVNADEVATWIHVASMAMDLDHVEKLANLYQLKETK
jgi:hypothetical protein